MRKHTTEKIWIHDVIDVRSFLLFVHGGHSMKHKLLRVGEAAKVLNVSRWTIYRWVEEDRLKATKIGKGSLRIFGDSIEALVEQNRKDKWGLAFTEAQ